MYMDKKVFERLCQDKSKRKRQLSSYQLINNLNISVGDRSCLSAFLCVYCVCVFVCVKEAENGSVYEVEQLLQNQICSTK